MVIVGFRASTQQDQSAVTWTVRINNNKYFARFLLLSIIPILFSKCLNALTTRFYFDLTGWDGTSTGLELDKHLEKTGCGKIR